MRRQAVLHKVFVYGTLKLKGSANSLMGNGTLLKTHTLEGVSFHDLGGFPAVTLKGKQKVNGELWEVSTEVLSSLDRYEGHPALFKRTKMEDDYWIYIYQGGVTGRYVKEITSGTY